MAKLRMALVGLGQIARHEHLPVLAQSDVLELVAIASPDATHPSIPIYPTLGELLAARDDIEAVTICTPPQGRHPIARQAIEAGCHVMLEKPPGATLSEVHDLGVAAEARGVTLFASWHTRGAPAIEPAREWLATRKVRSARIIWREDVRRWHPGQEWLWHPGGLGVFDPGINGLSAATRILPQPIFLEKSELFYPSNRNAPIAARLQLRDGAGAEILADFDLRETGQQVWDVMVETDDGLLHFTGGGGGLTIAGRPVIDGAGELEGEYEALYQHFGRLIRSSASDVDLAPLRLVADAFLLADRKMVEPFIE